MHATVTVICIWIACLGAAAQFGKFAVLFDRVAALYPGYSAPMIGLVVSTVGLVGLFLGSTAGLFVSWLGLRRVFIAALLLGALVSAVEAMLPALPVMLALRAAEGLSHLAIVVAAPVLTAQMASPRWQPAAMTLYSSFFAVSFAGLAQIGPGMVDAGGLQAVFWGHAVFMAVSAGLMAFLLPKDRSQPRPALGLTNLLREHKILYASPHEAAPAMGFVCYTFTFVAFLTLMPQQFLGRPEQMVLAIYMPLISVLASMVVGIWAMRHFSAVKVVMFGFALAVLGAIALGLVWGNSSATVLAAFAVAAALGLVQSASFASIPQLNQDPAARARAAGAIAQLGNLGTTTGTPLLVWLISVAGETGLATFLVVFSLAGIGVHLLQARRREIR
jgi:MFS transporter, DHA1 family, inner membrane transport protein